jgi:UDP-N-acetylglucosamine/UDP-N-acetyl-alpha-D-glucosaminouronate 4-epimerase
VKVLVTGGAGFIGHHLIRALLARGDEVVVLDNFSTGLRWRLDGVLDRITLVEGTILDPDTLDRAMAGCEVILHQAAIPSVARSVVNPRATTEANVNGTIEVMLAAARTGVRRLVFAGSSSVYGIPELPTRETQRPGPRSPYGASKIAGEHYIHTLGQLHGVETVVLRYFNVFGPGQDPNSEYAAVIPRFTTAVLAGVRPTIYGDGETTRDFTYIENVVSANLLAADQRGPSELTCNIACGTRSSLLMLLELICAELGVTADPIFEAPRAGDVPHSLADISLAREALGYEVIVPFEEGVARTVAWYRERATGQAGAGVAPSASSEA